MRKFIKSLTDVSLIQQICMIIVIFAVAFILFFSVYLKDNINDFVTNQVLNLLDRTQETFINSYRSGQTYTDTYSAEISHFVYRKGKLITMFSSKIYTQELLAQVNDFAQSVAEEHEGVVTFNEDYYYHIEYIENESMVISIVEKTYGSTIENQLLNGLSNNTAIAFTITFFILMVWVSSIITPLKQIQSYIEKIKGGDNEAVLNIDRKDEIGELADAIVNMRDEIQKQDQAKEEMIHNISHDLKTPIATIKSYAESIKDGIYPYDTLEKSVDVIIENADRLEKKVYSLLLLNRLDYIRDQEKETDKTTEMHMVVDNVLLSLKMIKPEIQIMRALKPAVFKGDSENWHVVVSNLLDNALRYAKSRVKITLDSNSLTIFNDGSSISQERMDKLFKPFEKGTKGKFGLGLSICYKVCDTYGYSIVAENLEDGVIFRITAKDQGKKRLIKMPEKKNKIDS